MPPIESKNFFSSESLTRLAAVQGKTIEKIVCHLWQNNFNKNEVMELIDNVELIFTNQQKLTISSNSEGDALDVIDFNYTETTAALEKEFEGKIKLFAVNASETKMWIDIKGKILQNIKITKQDEFYAADSILLDFGDEKRTISINPVDGLMIDYYEEV